MATRKKKGWSWQRLTALMLFGLLAPFAINAITLGQTPKGKPDLEVLPEPSEPYKIISSGYVRPGDVADKKANGQIVSAAHNPEQKTNVLGGTVYFVVLQRTQPMGWGLNLDNKFVNGLKSPSKLDTSSEYIYLFQIVNDRGLGKRKGAQPAVIEGKAKPKNQPISSFVLDLQVAPDELTSWGYFKDTGFAQNVAKMGQQVPILVSDAGADQLNPGYFPKANIHPFNNWTIKSVDAAKNPKKAPASKNGVKQASDDGASAKAPQNPVSVEVLYSVSSEKGAFRVDFASRKGKGQGSPLALGEYSPIVGFTSNRPPKLDSAVRLEDANAAKDSDGITMASDATSGIALTTQLMPTPAAAQPEFGADFFGGLQNAIDEFVGYTAPGIPGDALIAKGKKRIDALGATVYFAVLKLTGGRGDSWGTGTEDFDDKFHNGQSFQNKQSPALDTKARYLYLYQLVNDRGIVNTDRPLGSPLKMAADTDEGDRMKIVPVAAMGVELEVDPRYITSWGHFRSTGFSFVVPNKKFKKKKAAGGEGILTISDEPQKDSNIRLAASSMPPLLLEFRDKRYQPNSPPISLGKLRRNLNIGSATENLTKTSYFRMVANLSKQPGGIKLASWQETMLASDKGAESLIVKEPAHVQLLYRGYSDDNLNSGLLQPAGLNSGLVQPFGSDYTNQGKTVFRVDWWGRDVAKNDQNLVVQGAHGPIVGFTSDLPPKWGSMWIENKAAASLSIRQTGGLEPAVAAVPGTAAGASGVRTVADLGVALTAGPSAVALAAVPGTAVPGATPVNIPVPDGAATPAAAGGTPVVGGAAATGGGLGGFPGGGGGGGFPAGGFGGVGGVPSSGGGFGGGFGGGNGGGDGQADTTGDTTQDQGGEQGGNQTINFNASLVNQQAQAQSQAQLQFQLQKQKQSQKNGGNGGDVSAPTAVLLAILGLPVLFCLRRRKQVVSAAI